MIYWDDIQEGQELPAQSQKVGYLELNRFAGANDELIPIHMDPEYSKNVAKLPDVIIMGNLKLAYMANLVTNWAGEGAWLRKLAVSYRKTDVVNTTLTLKGRVTRKTEQDGVSLAELDVWIENEQGEVTTPGTASVVLPRR